MIELQVLSITNSQAQVGAFAMLLKEMDGKRQLPVIIGPAEAQATALCLERVKTPRPLTHELFDTCLRALGTTLTKVLIYKVLEGVFFSYVYLKRGEEIIQIDSRTSDAVALAIRSECPIYIYESILETEYIRLTEDMIIRKSNGEDGHKESSAIVRTPLEEALKQAIKNENYELAAQIRDEIKQKKEE